MFISSINLYPKSKGAKWIKSIFDVSATGTSLFLLEQSHTSGSKLDSLRALSFPTPKIVLLSSPVPGLSLQFQGWVHVIPLL